VSAALLGHEESGHLTLHSRGCDDRTRLGQGLRPRGDIRHITEYFADGIDHHRPNSIATRGKRGPAAARRAAGRRKPHRGHSR
jgi:hypothetical protein